MSNSKRIGLICSSGFTLIDREPDFEIVHMTVVSYTA